MKQELKFGLAILLASLFLSMSVLAGSGQGAANRSSLTDDEKNTVRLGFAGVKSSTVGKGVNAAELAGAIQNSLPAYLKGTKVEIVLLEAKLPAAIEAEAKEKGCNFILYATVSHKKGGSGIFKKIAPVLSVVAPMAGLAGVGVMIAGQVVQTTANVAASSVKPKDEITLDISLKNGETVTLIKQFKAKAKAAGEDIISPLVEQAAQAIVDTVGK